MDDEYNITFHILKEQKSIIIKNLNKETDINKKEILIKNLMMIDENMNSIIKKKMQKIKCKYIIFYVIILIYSKKGKNNKTIIQPDTISNNSSEDENKVKKKYIN